MSYCPAAQIGRNEGNLAAIVTHNRLSTVFENSNSYSKATIVKFDVVEGRIQTEPEILAQHSRNRINRDTAHLVFFLYQTVCGGGSTSTIQQSGQRPISHLWPRHLEPGNQHLASEM